MKGRFFVALDAGRVDRAFLDAPAARHVRALRLAPGDAVCAIVGPGRERHAVVESLGRERVVLALGPELPPPACDPACERTLAVALADPARFDLVVEKATELGATVIQPLVAARSQTRDVPPARLARWRRIATAASEQCGRTTVPEVRAGIPLPALAASLDPAWLVWLLTPGGVADAVPAVRAAEGADAGRPLVLVVGPEGGFTAEEQVLLRAHGARAVTLGRRVLRFETAAIAALAVAGAVLPDRAP